MITKVGCWVAALICVAVASGCQSSGRAGATCASELKTLAPVTQRGSLRATGSHIEISGANAGFTPTCVTDVPRGVIELTVHNTGQVIHDIVISAQHIRTDIGRGHSVTVHVRIGSDPVVFECSYHRSLGMIGVLIPASG